MSDVAPVPRRGRVAVVGAINLDLVVAAPRLPAPGETVVGPGVQRHGGGKGANAAVAAARAGGQVAFVGAVGDDPVADEVQRDLRDAGVDCRDLARLADTPTGMALIVVDPGGENQIAVGAGANARLDAARVAAALAERAESLDAVLISTEVPDDVVSSAVAAAADAGLTVVLNPAPPTPAVGDALAHHPILTPNRGELAELLRAVAGREAADEDTAGSAATLAGLTGAPVIVTLGSDGVLLAPDAEPGSIRRWPAPRVQARDATGAGDTFNGVLVAALAGGAELAVSVARATVAASLSVTAVGARQGMPTAAEIDMAIRTRTP